MSTTELSETPLNIVGNTQTSLSISGTGAQTAALTGGIYDVWSDQDCFIKAAATTASDVTTATGYKVFAGATITGLMIPDQYVVGAITASATGTLGLFRTA